MEDPSLPRQMAGTVIAVGRFTAYVNLDEGAGRGIVHISQLSNNFDQPPMSDHLSVGDRIQGICLGRDQRTALLEISPRRLAGSRGQPASRDFVDWQVVRATEFAAILKCGAMAGSLLPTDHIWSRYRVLWEGGVLSEGATIAARWSGSMCGDRHALELPTYQLDAAEAKLTELSGEIILWRPNATRKKDEMLRNILYAHTERGFVFRIECNDVVAIEEHFSIGETVRFRQARASLNGIPMGELVSEQQPRAEQSQYTIGQRVTGKVTRLLPGGALVLLADRRVAFLPAAAVLPGKGFIGSVLKVGDWVDGVISELAEKEGRVGVLSFLRLARDSEVSSRGRDPLIDLRSERRRSAKGGYGRDASFRIAVTDTYEHVCCCCGESYRVGKVSSMEAGHVIPRGKRGADHLSNGLCLCPIHHWAFDRGLFTIGTDLSIRVAKVVLSEEPEVSWLTRYNGHPATFPTPPQVSCDALNWHCLNIFLGDAANATDSSG